MRYVAFDEIQEIIGGKYARAKRNVTLTEDFFITHFPKFPTMPGVLLIETMVQVSRCLVRASSDLNINATVLLLKNTKFRKYVRPGDQLVIEAQIISISSQQAIVKAGVKVDGKEVASIGEVQFCCSVLAAQESVKKIGIC